MLFSSFEYLLGFFPLVVIVCIAVRRRLGPRAAQLVILVASIIFYGWWKPSNLPLLAASILVNWFLARWLSSAQQPARKRILQLGLVLNIGYLCLFKYVNFFLSVLHLGIGANFYLPDLEFPLGISFFTLSQVMYLVDCYEGLLPAAGLFDYSTFVSFFPYVISGPIPKAKRILHQFDNFGGNPEESSALLTRGLYLFTIGLFKKAFFASVFGDIANVGFKGTGYMPAAEAWSFSFAYVLQIYFDFSGYSDMAIGSALMLGIEIPRNFDAPLRSKSVIEFWQRWHISLSNFITTYLYTPFLKALPKVTLFYSALATLFAMTIAGLWHGPNWTFILFGVIHGLALGINQYWRKKKVLKLPLFISWICTFFVITIGMIFFRAHDLTFASHMILSLFNPHHPIESTNLLDALHHMSLLKTALILPLGVIVAFFGKSSDEISREFTPTSLNAVAVATMLVACLFFLAFNTSQDFLYFKF